MTGLSKAELEKLPDEPLLRMHDDIHRIMEARSLDMKARYRAQTAKSPAPSREDIDHGE